MRQTRCQDVGRALQDLVDGLLPADEAARLRGHADSCARCDGRLARRWALQRALMPPPDIELPSGFRASLLERLCESAAQPTPATPPAEYATPSESWSDRVAAWWGDVQLSPKFQPVAVLAGLAMAVVLASTAAQVVGTWRDRGIGSPAGVTSTTISTTPAPGAPGDVASAPGDPSPSASSPPSVVPAPPVSEGPLQLAAVSPEVRSVVLRNGFDVVAAADGAPIDPARSTVHLRLDGRSVAPSGVRVTRDFVSYTPEGTLAEGSHTVHVEVRGADGQSSSVEWDFYVVGS